MSEIRSTSWYTRYPRGRVSSTLVSFILPVAGILLWMLLVRGPDQNTIPSVGGVVGAAGRLVVEDGLFTSLAISLARVIVGFLIGVLFGTVLGMLIGRIPLVRWVMVPIVEVFRPIAPIAWIPLLIIWVGTGDVAPVIVIAYASFFPVVINVFEGSSRIDRHLVDVAGTFGTRFFFVFSKVILPASMPSVLAGARIGMGISWAAVVAAELAAGTGATGPQGIGALMMTLYNYSSDPNGIVVCMICVGLVGVGLNSLMGLVGDRLVSWDADHQR